MFLIDTPRSQFDKFKPSFVGAGLGWLPGLYRRAFEAGTPALAAVLSSDPSNGTREVSGILPRSTSLNLPIHFGQLDEGAPIPDELSGTCPYILLANIADGKITEINLRLHLLNIRMTLSKSGFVPSVVNADGAFAPLSSVEQPVGMLVVAAFEGDDAARFAALTAGLPSAALNEAKPHFRRYASDTLLSRIDLTMTWSSGAAAKFLTDHFGLTLGIPGAELPKELDLLTLGLFSPAQPKPFNALMRASGGFGICLPRVKANNVVIIMDVPKPGTGSSRDLYAEAVQQFGVTDDFRGILVGGIELHWLSDGNVGHGTDYSLDFGVSAFSFGDGHDANSSASWFLSFGAGITRRDDKSYLGLFTNLHLNAAIANGEPTRISLAATFQGNLGFPYAWLSKRQAKLTLSFEKWTANGQVHEDKVVSLELLGTHDRIFARITADDPVRMDPALFNMLAVAMTFAPIVASTGSIDTHGVERPPAANLRGYFADIGTGSSERLYVVAGLGYFFREAVKVQEIRVVGIRLQVQPAEINDRAARGKSDTALLFDYEVDYLVAINAAGVSSRKVTTRIDGTGIVIVGPDQFRWVQVPSGLRDLSIADPGIWEIGTLGKILKLTEVTIRREPRKELVIRLALSGNLGIITAGDFAFAMDLTGTESLRLETYPSQVSVEIPGVLKGAGSFVIDKSGPQDEIDGSLDLTITSIGIRFFAAARVSKVETATGKTTTAVLASAELEWAVMIPLASSGLGLKSISALYAMHFARIEKASPPGVPPALQWLKDAEGDVVKSVLQPKSKELWESKYDHWAFGIGVGLGLQASDVVMNLNSMLVIEVPGPKILIFSKLNILEAPKLNKAVKDRLVTGVLGLIEVDLERGEMTLAVLADISFQKFLTLHAPIEVFFALRNLAHWHLYLGRFDNPISAKLDLASVLELSASGYFMVAGDEIANAPIPNGPKTLPGMALALGAAAYVKIGGGSLYLRVDLSNRLFVSIAKDVYAHGNADLSGELRLFVVSIGASGTFALNYLRKAGGPSSIYVTGEICGHVKVLFVKIAGCVSLHIGASIADDGSFAPLISDVSVLSGSRVALRGQGATGTFDSELAKLGGPSPVGEVPLDAVLSIKMPVPPSIGPHPAGFAAHVEPPSDGDTHFNLGQRVGFYRLYGVVLKKVTNDGEVDVDYDSAPCRWWTAPQSGKGGQPVARQLALLTRNPLGVSGSLPSRADLDIWVKAVLGGICEPVIAPQACLFQWEPRQAGTGTDGEWILPALLPSADVIHKIDASGATPEQARFMKRASANGPNDPLPGFPAYVGGVEVGRGIDAERFAYLKMKSIWIPGRQRISSDIIFDGEVLLDGGQDVELLIAHRLHGFDRAVRFKVTDDRSVETTYTLDKVDRRVLGPGEAATFNHDAPNWRANSSAFVSAQGLPQFRDMRFELIRIRSKDTTPLKSISVSINPEISCPETITLLIAGLKFVPLAELAREKADQAHKQRLTDDLRDFLNPREVPLLDPSSNYKLTITWQADGDHTAPQSNSYTFKTTDRPPRDIVPHLITSFPYAGEKFHYPDDTPGIVLGSNELFRVLDKFPTVQLRVTITEDGGNPVGDPGGTRRWDQGVIVSPAEILAALTHPVPGFEIRSVAGLPTALEEAIFEMTKAGAGLDCLGEIKLPDAGLWIGFETNLRSLSGYLITIEVVDAPAHQAVRIFADQGQKRDEPLLRLAFRTGLHRNLQAHGEMFGAAVIRNRLVEAAPLFDAQPVSDAPPVRSTPDKSFEDAIALAANERGDREGDVRLTVFWRRQADSTLVAIGVMLESTEPLIRRTKAAAIARAEGQDYVRDLVDMPMQSIDPVNSVGLSDFVVSASGFAIYASISASPGSPVTLGLTSRDVDRISRATGGVHITVRGGSLDARVASGM